MREITDEKIEKYLGLTKRALDVVKIAVPESDERHATAMDFLNMARSYYHDALHFKEKGDFVNAFAAVNYAHAWLDAGARTKLFDVGDEAGKLFASD